MNILFTFVGSRDPRWQDSGGSWHDGPILSLLAERNFDRAYLFFNLGLDWNRRASQVLDACRRTGHCKEVHYVPLDILDVTDHAELYRVMNHACQEIIQKHHNDGARYYVATASGTPATQTIWVLLVQSSLVPGTLLHITHPQHSRHGKPLVREIDLNLDDFPQIQSPDEAKRHLSILNTQIESLRLQNALLQAQKGQGIDGDLLPEEGVELKTVLLRQEIAYIRLALAQGSGNAAAAARLLGIDPHTFRKRAISLGILNRKKEKT